MSISFIGPAGSFETPWIRYALLRDNVMHHLDGGAPSLKFISLYSIAGSLGGSHIMLSARKLRAEIDEVVTHLSSIPSSQLMISTRTQAVFRFEPLLPVNPSTEFLPNSVSFPWLDASAETLGEIFRNTLSNLQRITENCSEQDQVEVFDG